MVKLSLPKEIFNTCRVACIDGTYRTIRAATRAFEQQVILFAPYLRPKQSIEMPKAKSLAEEMVSQAFAIDYEAARFSGQPGTFAVERWAVGLSFA